MNRSIFLFLLSLMGFSLLQSCTIQKRKHLKGWHVTSKRINKGASAVKSTSVIKPSEIIDSNSSSELKECEQGVLTIVKDLQKNKSLLSREKPQTNWRDQQLSESVENVLPAQPPRLNEPSKKTSKSDLDEYKKSSWVAKMFGGILGVLLALVVIGPLALVLLIFNEGDIDDSFTFSVSREDSPFVQAFKNSYNVVFKIGATIIIWAMVIFGVILMLSAIYLEHGVIGVVLGILGFILAVWLLYLLLKGTFELLFPSFW